MKERRERQYPSPSISREAAEEYTQALGQIFGGGWRQILWARQQGIPRALGLTEEEWVRQRLGGYVKLSVEERREAVKELTAPKDKGGHGLSNREAADVLGVGRTTISRDLGGPFGTPSDTDGAPLLDSLEAGGPNGPLSHPNLVDIAHMSAKQLKALARQRQKDAYERACERTEVQRVGQVVAGTLVTLPPTIDVRLGDFREVLADIPDHSVQLIFTDPPYERKYLPLWRDLGIFAARVLASNGMLVSYSGQVDLPSVMSQLAENLDYWWLGAIVHGGPGMMQLNDHPVRKFINGSKPLLFYVPRGYTGQTNAVDDTVKGKGREKGSHDWQQGLSEAEYYLEHLADEGACVVDPFLGGGTTALAARKLGRAFIGAEIERDAWLRAKERIQSG